MSVSAPPAQAAPPQGAPATHTATHSFPDLSSLAADVQTDLQALATGLAQAGAAPGAVTVVNHMAGTISQVRKVLDAGPPIPNPAHSAGAGPPSPQGQPEQGPPQQQQGPAPGPPHAALGQAVAAIHEGMVAAHARKVQGQ